MMKRLALAGLLIGLLVLAGCADKAAAPPPPQVDADFDRVVSVTGELLPARWATVSAKVGGRVIEVLVEPGASVRAGAALVQLDTTDLELAFDVAQQEVIAQQAALDQLLAGSSQPMIERADRENAQQIEQAEVALRIKERQLEQARARDPAKDVTAAQAQVDQLLAQVAQAQAQSPQAQARIAQIELERAQIALDDAQDEYQQALDRPWEEQKVRDALAKALEQAQLSHRAAQARLDDAQGALQAHTASLRVLAAQVTAARIGLEQAQETQQAHRLALAILEDEVENARLALAHLRAWENPYRDPARAQEIEQAEARLEQARGAVAQIEQQMQDATLVSPLDGTVGLVSVRAGEQVVPAQSLVIVGDLDTLRVETTDLDEIDVVRVSVGQTAAVVFDALPDRVFEGYVTRISPMAEPGSGGVHYSVVLELTEVDPALRWGMTAFVDITVGGDS
jgi:multidrug resistance efflux pump